MLFQIIIAAARILVIIIMSFFDWATLLLKQYRTKILWIHMTLQNDVTRDTYCQQCVISVQNAIKLQIMCILHILLVMQGRGRVSA